MAVALATSVATARRPFTAARALSSTASRSPSTPIRPPARHPRRRLALPRSPRTCTIVLAAEATQTSQPEFLRLANYIGFDATGISAEQGEYGRGVFAQRGFRAGEPILSVPLSCCLIVGREYGMSLPGANWEQLQAGSLEEWPLLAAFAYGLEPGAFSAMGWELKLALAVADLRLNRTFAPQTTAEDSRGGGGGLLGLLNKLPISMKDSKGVPGEAFAEWLPLYLQLLPKEPQVPASLPPQMLQELQDSSMIDAAAAEQRKMGDLLGEVAGEVGEGVTQELLTWALGIVKSRSFDATPETFVLSPLIDLINHAWEGAEICFSYGCNTAPNSELYSRYGMLRPDGNAYDVLPFGEVARRVVDELGSDAGGGGSEGGGEGEGGQQFGVRCIDMDSLEAALEQAVREDGGRWLQVRTTDARLKAVLASLAPLAVRSSGEGESEQARAVLAGMVRLVEAEVAGWPSSLEEDEAALRSGDVQQSLETVLRYRIERKRLWERAQWVIRVAAAAAAVAGEEGVR